MTSRRFLLVLMVAATLAAGVAATPGDVAPNRPAGRAEKVVVFSVPTLTWQTIINERPPVLSDLLARSAVASLSLRTIGARTTLAEGYATVAAGNRAGSAEGATVADAFPGGGAVVEGAAALGAATEAMSYGARAGALGQALAEADRVSGIVANADVVVADGTLELHREAAAAVMDVDGVVPVGRVDAGLSIADPVAPGGLRGDVDALAGAFEEAWATADLVLVEAADLARLQVVSGDGQTNTSASQRRLALQRADQLLGAVLDQVDLSRHLVMVVAPSSDRPGRDALGVAALAGPGIEPGIATSASTSRSGYVLLPDVAPTALASLGVDQPSTMNGVALASAGGPDPGPDLFARLAAANDTATFRDEATGPFSVAFVAFQIVGYALAAAALSRWPRLVPVARIMALITLALPSLAFLSGWIRYDRLGVTGYLVASFVVAAGMAWGALALGRRLTAETSRARALVAPLLLVGLTVTVLVVDVFLGSTLQLDTVFGYSPIVAGRFFGFGNLAFAQVAMGALVVVTGGWALAALGEDDAVSPRRTPRWWLALAAAFLTVVVIADGHPSFGADVGGVLALVPAGVVVLVLLARGRVRWRHVVAMVAITAVAVVGFAAADLSRPVGERTHVGRFAAQVLDGGTGVGTILQRKLEANLSLLFSSVWSLVIPVALAFGAYLLWYRPRVLGHVERSLPGTRALLVGGLVLAVLGGGLNDSGVAVPAMMLAVLLPYLTVLALDLARSP